MWGIIIGAAIGALVVSFITSAKRNAAIANNHAVQAQNDKLSAMETEVASYIYLTTLLNIKEDPSASIIDSINSLGTSADEKRRTMQWITNNINSIIKNIETNGGSQDILIELKKLNDKLAALHMYVGIDMAKIAREAEFTV